MDLQGSITHGEFDVKKTSIIGLSAIIPAIAMSSLVEAKTVLSAKERCFQLGQPIPGAKNWTLKIKPQQALSTKPGAIVGTVALAHGETTTYPPENNSLQLTGAASFVTSQSGEAPFDTVRIALIGNTYSSHDDGNRMVSWNASLILTPEVKGKIPGGQFVGFKTFTPLVGPDLAPSIQEQIDESVSEISCTSF